MNPIYKFELTIEGTPTRVYPIYKGDIAKDFEKESGEQFFRAKLSGELTFESDDYDLIVTQPFETEFGLEIFISYDGGQTWASYWTGTFWKTDCTFDDDSGTVVVKPSVADQYTAILAGLDKEYNLIDLSPEIRLVKADKRPMIQVYVPGQSVVACFLSGMWWEQDCTPESDEFKLAQTGDGKLNFALNKCLLIGEPSGDSSPLLSDIFTGSFNGAKFNPSTLGNQDFPGGAYTLRYTLTQNAEDYTVSWSILRASDSVYLWQYSTLIPDIGSVPQLPQTVTLTPVVGSGATGNVSLYVHEMPVYSRYICDVPNAGYSIGNDDIVPDNRNYKRVLQYYFPDTIYFSTRLSQNPTKWGLYQPGQYYQIPYLYWSPELFPVARNAWGRVSVWFTFSQFNWATESQFREPFTIRNTYPLSSVISVLLGQMDPNITHEATTAYSAFLYGTNLIGIMQTLLIAPKSNIINAEYDQPAQKAPITLRAVLDMLRDCFRCYWFIDGSGRFRIEHIEYFRNGGSYSGTPVVGIDLTAQKVSRNGKPWAFGRDKYKFDKPAMASRYEFGWMDDCTQLFEGYPIEIRSKYVNPDNIEQIQVAQFTADIDYILLNPSEISKDGFVLLAGVESNELSAPESYTLNGNNDVPFRYPVPEEWNDTTLRFVCNLSNGTGFLRVYSGATYIQKDFSAGNNVIEIAMPSNCTAFRLYGTVGATLQVTGVYIGKYQLPYINYNPDGNDHNLQNAYVAFCILQNYYAYDMPAPDYEINGVQMTAIGTKQLKMQTIRFPAPTDPDLVKLIRTNLGNGTIEKISVTLSSRNANATLKYDTE